MKSPTLSKITATCILPAALALVALAMTGCETDTRTTIAYRDSRPAYVYADDDYVYYPQYEMYYSNRRHQYGYREGNSWVWRQSPTRVETNVLVSTPSVHLDFHDSPERHHSEVIKTYPRNWRQDDRNRGHDDHRDDRKNHDKDHDGRKDHDDNDRQH